MAAKKQADTVKVVMQRTSLATKRGDVVEVPRETAEALLLNGYAVSVDQAGKDLEKEILGTAPDPSE